jgi:predicted GNAT family N-acyltransferase
MRFSRSVEQGVKLIEAEETWELRKKILRSQSNNEDYKFTSDLDPTCFHLGYKIQDRIIAIGSFYFESHKELDSGNPYRLRGMATDFDFQGQGYGEIVLLKSFEVLNSKKCDLLWCNARIRAESFYAKLGFHVKGEIFKIEGTGPHKVMYKRFNPR